MKKKILFFTVLFLGISFYVNSQPLGYYDAAQGLGGEALKTALYNIIKGHTEFPYTSDSGTDVWDILKATDADLTFPDSVYLIYTGGRAHGDQEWNGGDGWEREHVWAKSHGFSPDGEPEPGPGTDVHNLRPVNSSVNSTKNNRWFAECDEPYYLEGEFTGCYFSSTQWLWEPRAEDKGDVARMMFYMATRYEGENGEPDCELIDYIPANNNDPNPIHAKLSDLLMWHIDDPVDDWERRRNNIIFDDYQHNRNPFIDHPEWVEYIWGECDFLRFTSLPSGEATVGQLYSSQFTFTKTSESTQTVALAENPEWLQLNQTDNHTAVLSGTPLPEHTGVNHVKISLTSNDETIYYEFDINVTQTIIAQADFTTCLPENWTTYNVSGTKNWSCDSEEANFQANAYYGSGACNDWLITPEINFANFSGETLTFRTWTQYTDTQHPRLKVKYSENYVTGQNPENYTWIDLPGATLPAQNSAVWTSSGTVSISDKENMGFIAFQYTSSGTVSGACEWWKIDDIIISGVDKAMNVYKNDTKDKFTPVFSPNPFKDLLFVGIPENSNGENYGLEISDITGKILLHENLKFIDFKAQINTENLPQGLLFVKISTSSQTHTSKIIKL